MRLARYFIVPVLALLGLLPSFSPAGPAVIDGTDANDHGGISGNANETGWLYMESVLRAMAPVVGNGNRQLVDLGTTSGEPRNAIASAFNLSNLPGSGWSLVHIDGEINIGSFLDGNTVNGANLSSTGIIYLPSSGLVSGDMAVTELQAINVPSRAVAINNFVGGNGNPAIGGGLFAMGETGTGAFGWLNTLVPGIQFTDVGGGGVSTDITLTPDGQAAFPALTNTQLAGADPWHDHFTNIGDLKVFGIAPQGSPPVTRNVIIGSLEKLSNQGPTVDDATVSVSPGDLVSHTFTATDPNGDPLTWEFVDFSGPAVPVLAPSFNVASQLFEWDTTGSILGTYLAQARARDPLGLADIGTLTIHVPEPTFALVWVPAAGLMLRRRQRYRPSARSRPPRHSGPRVSDHF